jgi:hypothetical protein
MLNLVHLGPVQVQGGPDHRTNDMSSIQLTLEIAHFTVSRYFSGSLCLPILS